MKINRKTVSKIIIGVLLSLPFLRYYNIPGTDIGITSFLLTILDLFSLLILFMVKKGEENKRIRESRKWLLLYLLWSILITVYFYFSNGSLSFLSAFNTVFVMTSVGLLLFVIMIPSFDYTCMCRLYDAFVSACVVIYLIQWMLYFTGMTVSFKIPLLDYNDSWDGLNDLVFGMSPLPTSLFSERSHLCVFLLPYLSLKLLSGYKNGNFLTNPIVLSIVIVSTISGNGIIGLLILWILYFLFYKGISKKSRVLIIAFGITLIIGLFFVLEQLPLFSELFSQLFFDTSGSTYHYTKADYRIYRGFDIFGLLPRTNKILGVGYNQMEVFSLANGIVSVFDRSYLSYEYFSMIAALLIYSGFIGVFLYYKHLSCLFRTKNVVARCLIVLYFAMMFSTCMLFSETQIIFFLVIICSIRIQNY